MAEYAPEDRMLAVGVLIVLAVAALVYSVWSMSGQRPPDDLPECRPEQVLVLDDPSNPECR